MYNRCFLVICLGALLAACSPDKKEQNTDMVLAARDLQSLVDEYKTLNPDLPGITAAILTGGKLTEASAGMADVRSREAMTPRHAIGVASNTKMLTAVIILQLAEEGRLSLFDPLEKFLSRSMVDSLCTLGGVSYGWKVNIRQLLKHQSGIRDFVDGTFLSYAYTNPEVEFAPMDVVHYAMWFGQPYFVPGTPGRYQYSSTNFTLLGMVIEKVMHKPYAEVLNERILTPCGMKNSFLLGTQTPTAPLAHGYIELHDATYENNSWTWSTGGLASTPADMGRFMVNLEGGKLFRSPTTLWLMKQFTNESMKDYGYAYGLGFLRMDFGYGFMAEGHLGSLPSYTSACFYLPLQQTYFFVGINKGETQFYMYELLGKMYQLLVQRYDVLPKPPMFPGFPVVHGH